MPIIKLIIEYDGTNLSGWQKQDELPTAQGILEQAIYDFCQHRAEVVAAGRTDAGVHATGQVVHFEADLDRTEFSIRQGLNHHLEDKPVKVISAEFAENDFHARFSAVRRHYQYIILNRPAPPALDINRVWWVPQKLDVNKMKEAAEVLIGYHDFTSFRAAGCQANSPLRTIEVIEIHQIHEKIFLNFSAPSFLYHQVRNLVGALKHAGEGKTDAAGLKSILEAKDRTIAPAAAPACGLYFTRVDY